MSRRLATRAAKIDASFRSRPGVLSGHASSPDEMPIFADRAKGAYIYDVDGRPYLDFMLAFGAVILGHADEGIDDAVIAEIRRGMSPTLHTRTQLHLAELICATVPGTEMVTFLRTGSDATGAAVRIARAHTGRRHILRWGYNGWHDWCAPRAAGIIPEVRNFSSTFSYGDLAALEVALKTREGDVAAVIMMPMEVEIPTADYLGSVASLSRRYGALFILDEVRSGFRLALGGAQQHFGIRADLAVFSKAMANGYCISAIAGPANVMRAVERISLSSLFFRSSEGMAAALATITRLRDTDAIQRLWELGRRFQAGLSKAASHAGVRAAAVGIPPMPFLAFEGDSLRRKACAKLFVQEMLKCGVLLHPDHHWFICSAMTEHDIDQAVAHAATAFATIAAGADNRPSQSMAGIPSPTM